MTLMIVSLSSRLLTRHAFETSFPLVLLRAHSPRYLKSLGISAVVLGVLVYLGSFMEFARKASGRPDKPFEAVPEMALLDTLILLPILFPFVVLFGTSGVFRSLSASEELTALKSSGYSGWQILSPAIAVVFGVWLILLGLINPITSVMRVSLDDLKFKYLDDRRVALEISETGLWVRQAVGDGSVYLNAGHATVGPDTTLDNQFSNVSLIFVNKNGVLDKIYRAKTARLDGETWLLRDVSISWPGRATRYRDEFALTLPITIRTIEENFADPATISIWNLPKFIDRLERSGLNAAAHIRQFHTEIASVLLSIAMLCLAYLFNGTPKSDRKTTLRAIAFSTTTGFTVYMITSLLLSIAHTALPFPALVVWVGHCVALMLSVFALLVRAER